MEGLVQELLVCILILVYIYKSRFVVRACDSYVKNSERAKLNITIDGDIGNNTEEVDKIEYIIKRYLYDRYDVTMNIKIDIEKHKRREGDDV